ncbi:type II secretion system minor pseudopilin GspH [Legionella sp. km772]|uniref:type II secretion system minor pseudopilin GspH n=1 Tax=Legionella sp. km772 TaxID=2498111 RepID=UPI000F8D9273|nr:type II secretion system minor pseudopilin GspH [Legionella sp. km772]RUR08278.1 prepilin-type N-terminal cleavage/methylation domain-containing protein [Legionella sp. km772]
MNINKGFTLIEILVVIVIIGITLGFALIAFGDFGESKKITYAGEQVEHLLQLAQQQAILENSTLGLKIDNQSYQILKFQNTSQWRTVTSRHLLFKIHYLPKGMIITLKTSNQKSSKDPGIIINSSGETNSFTLIFGTKKEPTIAVLTGQDNGELSFSTATSNGK